MTARTGADLDDELRMRHLKKALKKARAQGLLEPDLPEVDAFEFERDGSVKIVPQHRPSVAQWVKRRDAISSQCPLDRITAEEIKGRVFWSGYYYGKFIGLHEMITWLKNLIATGTLNTVKEFRECIKAKDVATKAERDRLRKLVPHGKSLDKETRAIYNELILLVKTGLSPQKAVHEYAKRHRLKPLQEKRLSQNFCKWWYRNLGL